MKNFPLVAAVLILSASLAGAQEPLPKVSFGEPGYGGTGCPDGTGLSIRGFGNQAAFYVFDGYKVGDGGRSVDRKTCAIAIPVDVPAGVSVAVRNVGVRGAVKLPDGLDAQLNVEAFAAGETGPVNEIKFSGATDTGYFRLLNVADEDLDWSACGEDINLRVNTSLRTRGTEDAAVSLNALIVYPLATKAC
ncbi:MAG: DUF4360 domain-containing protein [Hyphomicrobiales bacterium]|nr:MAG: DUF4360 domain-containing protein [Hyphomicrobiales bacterium]